MNYLFLCTGNSCRSQMAEGLFNNFRSDLGTSYSAGIKKHGLNPYAIAVMKEIDIDITGHESNLLEEIKPTIGVVITVCKNAHDTCPIFPGEAKVIHRGFDDPPFLAKDLTAEDEILAIYRRVRDEILEYIKSL
jgi:arsenate reductase